MKTNYDNWKLAAPDEPRGEDEHGCDYCSKTWEDGITELEGEFFCDDCLKVKTRVCGHCGMRSPSSNFDEDRCWECVANGTINLMALVRSHYLREVIQ